MIKQFLRLNRSHEHVQHLHQQKQQGEELKVRWEEVVRRTMANITLLTIQVPSCHTPHMGNPATPVTIW